MWPLDTISPRAADVTKTTQQPVQRHALDKAVEVLPVNADEHGGALLCALVLRRVDVVHLVHHLGGRSIWSIFLPFIYFIYAWCLLNMWRKRRKERTKKTLYLTCHVNVWPPSIFASNSFCLMISCFVFAVSRVVYLDDYWVISSFQVTIQHT